MIHTQQDYKRQGLLPNNYEFVLEKLLKFKYSTTKSRAIIRGKDFNLDLETFKKLIFSECYYCGYKGHLQNHVNRKSIPENIIIHINGIDRIDNDGDYTKDNCLPCCSHCNEA